MSLLKLGKGLDCTGTVLWGTENKIKIRMGSMQAICYAHAGGMLHSRRRYAMLTQVVRYAPMLAIHHTPMLAIRHTPMLVICHAATLAIHYAAMLVIRYAPILLILRWKGGGLGAQPPAS